MKKCLAALLLFLLLCAACTAPAETAPASWLGRWVLSHIEVGEGETFLPEEVELHHLFEFTAEGGTLTVTSMGETTVLPFQYRLAETEAGEALLLTLMPDDPAAESSADLLLHVCADGTLAFLPEEAAPSVVYRYVRETEKGQCPSEGM